MLSEGFQMKFTWLDVIGSLTELRTIVHYILPKINEDFEKTEKVVTLGSTATLNHHRTKNLISELQAVMVEGVAHPGVAQSIGSQALVILTPDALIFEGVNAI
jgi:glutamate racemase